jgi:hypothetical protein
MTVVCRPGLAVLTKIVAVLHSRNAEIHLLHYDAPRGDTRVVLDVSDPDVGVLADRLRRLVDVFDVAVAGAAPVAVAS